ncbi:hypothetical protein SLH49_11240 [Cognatiyoonia sp. IB215446]|uniref:hypothetical protein n=1 Tax=Cognatiyoonia sp. IB215446 TaxID=3097355 RepID=UPI002A13668B|nr:hypothetical protein [Cognatiyoonia sp. IB215446]MDX8348562.1 hypothetical protein [Cognatiyoonia sp. IB215446]
MSYVRSVSLSGLVVLTAACTSTDVSENDTNPDPASTVIALNANGTIPDQNYSGAGINKTYTTFSNGFGFGYAYGSVRGTDDFLGVAGFRTGAGVGDAVTTGSVSYNAAYDFTRTRGNTEIERAGNVTLTADFTTGSGTVAGADGGLVIDGTFDGTDLDGSVTFDGVTAELDGAIGQDRIVGAFAGHDQDGVLVGGFAGDAN